MGLWEVPRQRTPDGRIKNVLLAKPKLDTREVGVMHSCIGLEQPCIYVKIW